MVDYNTTYTPEGVTRIEITGEELTKLQADRTAFANKSGERKLVLIKEIRLKKLQETDYLSNSDVTMPDNIKTWRQSLRDLPQDFSTEEQYDLLLARDEQGQLTHSIWSKP